MHPSNNENKTKSTDSTGSAELRYTIGSNESPSTALITAFAEVVGKKPLEIGPVFQYIDIELLDAIIESSSDQSRRSSCSVIGSIEGYGFRVNEREVVVFDETEDKQTIPP